MGGVLYFTSATGLSKLLASRGHLAVIETFSLSTKNLVLFFCPLCQTSLHLSAFKNNHASFMHTAAIGAVRSTLPLGDLGGGDSGFENRST